MKALFCWKDAICLCAAFAAALMTNLSAHAAPVADLILYNAKVWTVDATKPAAQAVAVRKDRIIFVGSDTQVMAFKDSRTQLIDLHGAMLLPGFNDGHTHFENAVEWFFEVQLPDVENQAEMLKQIRITAARVPGDLWITGGGDWEAHSGRPAEKEGDTSFKPFAPDLAAVDAVSNGHPLLFRRYDRIYFANSEALRRARITENTPEPRGGRYGRDPQTHKLNGLLYGTAGEAMEKIVPPLSEAQKMIGARAVIDEFNAVGITSIQDISRIDAVWQKHIFPTNSERSYSDATIFFDLQKEGDLHVRVYPQLPLTTWADLAGVGIRPGSGDAMIHFGSLKDFADGSYMFAPFANRPSYSGNWAYRFVGEDVIRQNIEDADRAGYDVGVHVIGDKALHELLDWYENAIQKNGPRDRRFRIIHVEFATLADLQRAGRLHMIADITPNLLLSATSSISAMLGPEREKTAFAWRTMIENGVKLDIVSDLPGLYSHEDVSPYAPLENIYYAVTRIPVGGGAPWHPEQALTVREAIEAYTANPAFASHDEANKGTITEGKLADMVVLSQDILHLASPEQIRFTKVVMTVLGGKIVFQAKTE